MAQRWDVLRSTIMRPDAQQRWDTVYQFLLQWTPPPADRGPTAEHPQEEQDGNRCLCTGLDPAPATGTDD